MKTHLAKYINNGDGNYILSTPCRVWIMREGPRQATDDPEQVTCLMCKKIIRETTMNRLLK